MTHCTYPNCNCPFDAPADPNWCARGLPKAEASAGCGERVMIKFLEVKRAYYADPENVVAQWRHVGDTNWMDVIGEPAWDSANDYRIRPRTIRIGDIDVPEPVRKSIECGDSYYVPDASDEDFYMTLTWDDDPVDFMIRDRGIMHLSPEAAIAHAKALIIVSGGEGMTHYIRAAFVFIMVISLFWIGGMEFERGGKLVVAIVVSLYASGCIFAFSIAFKDSKK